MPRGKYYEYQIKRAALDDDFLAGNIDKSRFEFVSKNKIIIE